MKIKLYGGVLHGKEVYADPHASRIETNVPRRARIEYLQPWSRGPVHMDLPRRQSYTIETFHEARGLMYRRLSIGVIDGEKNLTEEERWDISKDLSRVPWSPVQPPSILDEFESWWNQTLYRHTGKEHYLYPEFDKLPYVRR